MSDQCIIKDTASIWSFRSPGSHPTKYPSGVYSPIAVMMFRGFVNRAKAKAQLEPPDEFIYTVNIVFG